MLKVRNIKLISLSLIFVYVISHFVQNIYLGNLQINIIDCLSGILIIINIVFVFNCAFGISKYTQNIFNIHHIVYR